MAFNRDKFASLVHYICWKAGDSAKLGAIKLNKICWLSDFRAFYETDQAITDARYVKRQFGPVPSAIQPVLRDLQSAQVISIRDVPFHGYTKREFTPLTEPNTSIFSDKELEIVNWATEFICEDHTGTSISEASHDHIWKVAADGEEIPYYTIFAIPSKITETDREWAAQTIEGLQ